MNRAAVLLILLLAASVAMGQNVGVSVSTSVPNAKFIVDGQIYTGFVTFTWPVGSKHILTVPRDRDGALLQYDEARTARFAFGGWTTAPTSIPTTPDFILTATPDITSVVANFSVAHRVEIQLVEGGAFGDGGCASPSTGGLRAGVVYVNGVCYSTNTVTYLGAVGSSQVAAYPFPGFIFRGWTFNGVAVNFATGQITINGPGVLSPRFEPARRVRFITEPFGLKVLVDRAEVPTPDRFPCPPQLTLPPAPPPGIQPLCFGEFDFAAGSQHVIGAPSPQMDDLGRVWIFDKFDIGGGQNTIFTTPTATNVSDTITAKFVRGARVSFLTDPAGLKLNIDGRENWPSYNFTWAVGTKLSIAAPEQQADAQGRRYVFKSWSNGGPASQELTVGADAVESGGLRLTAIYEALPRIVLRSSGPAVKVQVGDTECTTPCNLDQPAGTELTVSVPSSIPVSEVTRWDLAGWHDGAPTQRTLKFNLDHQTFHAIYRQMNRLTALAEPGNGAELKFSPASADGFYSSDSQVTVLAEARPGFRFRRWDGDLEGTLRSGIVYMSSPRVVRALLDKVPFIAPAGVRSAAVNAPEEAVAAGSIISIYGASLANQFEIGPSNPLAQLINGTAVRLDDRILALVYVSPEQINAVLPSDLPEGTYRLTVRTVGLPDVGAEFTVTRNAPGLFSNTVNSQSLAVALHEDGSPVSTDSPARRNEMITLLGTGFGPYDKIAPDGFHVPGSPVISLLDPVEVVTGETSLTPSWAGAVPGFTGVSGVRLRISSAIRSGLVDLKVVVNGKSSNTILLPVE